MGAGWEVKDGAIHRKDKGGSPSDVLLTDRPLLVAVAL